MVHAQTAPGPAQEAERGRTAAHPVGAAVQAVFPKRIGGSGRHDLAPPAAWARLLEDGTYLCSISTMYRLLSAVGEIRERRRQRTHPARKRPEQIARRARTPENCRGGIVTILAPTLEAFFAQRLMAHATQAPTPIAAYREGFRLLLAFTQQATGTRHPSCPWKHSMHPLIGAFLDHLQQQRGIAVAPATLNWLESTRCFDSPLCGTPTTAKIPS